MNTSNHKNTFSSARTSDKKVEIKSTSARGNEKPHTDYRKSALDKNKLTS
jgi:hypothetical protein